MNDLPEYKIGLIDDRPIRFYRYSEEIIKKKSIAPPYFFDRFEVSRMIDRKTETLDSFISTINIKKSLARSNSNNQITRNKNSYREASTVVTGLKTTSFEEASLYWLQLAIIRNNLALQIYKSIIGKPLSKITA